MAALPSTGMHNLSTLIKRLEAATSRLEDIASSSSAPDRADGGGVVAAAASSAPEIQDQTKAAGVTEVKETLPPSVAELDRLMTIYLAKFMTDSEGLDSTITEQAAAVYRACMAHRQYLLVATEAKKPDMTSPPFSELIKDLQQEMSNVNDVRENNRGSKFANQLAMVSEGMGALQWIVFEGNPTEYVGEVIGGVQLYGNRVLKEYKDKDQKQCDFVQASYGLLTSLKDYIKEWYPKGVTWNTTPTGVDLADVLRKIKSATAPTIDGASAPPAPASGGPPPPPPPPPLPSFDNAPPPPPQPATKAASGGDMGAVFDQLNRGSSVTAGLKKVDKSEMTHKNPSLRAAVERRESSEGLARSRSRGPETKPKPDSMRTKVGAAASKKEPKKELDGNKWIIENFDQPSAPLEIDVSLSQSILISRCNKTTIRLVGKANAISIDNSPRTNLIIDNLVSSVDVIKCPGFALQVLGSLPTVLLDQVDGAQIYLSKDSLGTDVFTSKCSGVNVNLPPVASQDDYKEVALPEQIRSYIKDGVVVSEIVEHAG